MLYLIGAIGIAPLAIVLAVLALDGAEDQQTAVETREAPLKASLRCRTCPTTLTYPR